MPERLAEIQQAIDSFQMERARELVSAELDENPGAAVFYLASQAALNHGQRVEYLQKALEYDPEYQPASDELADIFPTLKTESTISAPVAKVVEERLVSERAVHEHTVVDSGAVKGTVVEGTGVARPRLASFGKRWLAVFIDGIVVAIPTLMLIGATGISANLETALTAQDEALVSAAMSQFQSDLLVLNLLMSAIYNVFFMTYFNGQTLGKIILGLRVVKKNGRRISWLDALLRNVFGYTISGIFLLGYIWAVFDRENQGWHDKMAGTVVVDERNKTSK